MTTPPVRRSYSTAQRCNRRTAGLVTFTAPSRLRADARDEHVHVGAVRVGVRDHDAPVPVVEAERVERALHGVEGMRPRRRLGALRPRQHD